MAFIDAPTAWGLIQRKQFASLRQGRISPNFTWAEVFINRTDAAIATVRLVHLYEAVATANALEMVRAYLGGQPLTVTSWWRDPDTQRRLNDADRSNGTQYSAPVGSSTHERAQGVDVRHATLSPATVYSRLAPWWPGGLGDASHLRFTHIDTRRNATGAFVRARFKY